tara:strand:- start:1135 stop:2004 length:870 start_codon:yes stop_codon:yes gene_type:complete
MGLVHARIFDKLNFEIVGVLTSNNNSGVIAKKKLKETFGINTNNYVNFKEMIENVRPKSVTICSPPETHLKYIKESLKYNLFIFCEKPFFWFRNINKNKINLEFTKIKKLNRKKIIVNHSSVCFIEKIKNKNRLPKIIKYFKFSFFTNGIHEDHEIGVDLVPHASSIIIDLLGERNILNLKRKVSKSDYILNFNYGTTNVEFHFHQDKEGKKIFEFEINNQIFTRIQEGFGNTYKAFILDKHIDKKYEIEDPFLTKIKKFKNIIEGKTRNDEILNCEKIMKLSANLLLP